MGAPAAAAAVSSAQGASSAGMSAAGASALSHGIDSVASSTMNALNWGVNKRVTKRQLDFQERMSNTSYQRAVEDMKKAGLNPALMYGGSAGGASTPNGAAIASQAEIPKVGNKILDSMITKLTLAKGEQEIQNMKTQSEANNALRAKYEAEEGYIKSQTPLAADIMLTNEANRRLTNANEGSVRMDQNKKSFFGQLYKWANDAIAKVKDDHNRWKTGLNDKTKKYNPWDGKFYPKPPKYEERYQK